jgi:hypothetical protein
LKHTCSRSPVRSIVKKAIFFIPHADAAAEANKRRSYHRVVLSGALAMETVDFLSTGFNPEKDRDSSRAAATRARMTN